MGKLCDSGFEVAVTPFHPKINHRSTTTTGEAVPVVSLVVNAQAGPVVVVEGTQSNRAPANGFEIHVLADKFQHSDTLLDAF